MSEPGYTQLCGERVAACKDALLRSIEHLRRETAYDYPPRVVRDRIRDVRTAERAYRAAWKDRDTALVSEDEASA